MMPHKLSLNLAMGLVLLFAVAGECRAQANDRVVQVGVLRSGEKFLSPAPAQPTDFTTYSVASINGALPLLYVCQSNHGEVSTLICTMEGRPLIFGTQGHLVRFDNEGQLTVWKDAGVHIGLTVADRDLVMVAGLNDEDRVSTVDINPWAVVKRAPSVSAEVESDAAANTFTMRALRGPYVTYQTFDDRATLRYLTVSAGAAGDFTQTWAIGTSVGALKLPTWSQFDAFALKPILDDHTPIDKRQLSSDVTPKTVPDFFKDPLHCRPSDRMAAVLPARGHAAALLLANANQLLDVQASIAGNMIEDPQAKRPTLNRIVAKQRELVAADAKAFLVARDWDEAAKAYQKTLTDAAMGEAMQEVMDRGQFPAYVARYLNTELQCDLHPTAQWRHYLNRFIRSAGIDGVSSEQLVTISLVCLELDREVHKIGEECLAWRLSQEKMNEFLSPNGGCLRAMLQTLQDRLSEEQLKYIQGRAGVPFEP